jgi:CP family cyanate transporter-like MFS transporter
LALLLIILRSPNADQAQSLSAMVQSVGYAMGALSPLIAGSLFEVTGQWTATLWVLTGVAIAQALAGHGAGRIGHVRRRGISQDEMLIAEAGTA